MSDSIITLDVGGQMFKTQISTLTKYPDSMLAIMFQPMKADSIKDEKEKIPEIVTRNFGDRLASFFRINKSFKMEDEKLNDEKETDETKYVSEVVVDGTGDGELDKSDCNGHNKTNETVALEGKKASGGNRLLAFFGKLFKPSSDVVDNKSATEDQTVLKTVEEVLEQAVVEETTPLANTVNDLAPMTKDGAYFVDANPLYFGEILDYLRHGKIVSEDPNVLKGIKNLASYFRLEELIKELSVTTETGENEEVPEVVIDGTGDKNEADGELDKSGWVTLDLQGTKEIKVRLEYLTRFGTKSIMSEYFLGHNHAEILFSKKGWIKKESEGRFYVGRPCSTSEHMFNFIQEYPRSYVPNVPVEYTESCRDFLKQELKMFGFEHYYTVSQSFDHKRLCQFNWIQRLID